jgi:ADP-ribose pyrophosphatase YjhB (NUDIX family)
VIARDFFIMIDYSNIPDCFYRVSIKALILDEEGRFLLLREADGRWSFPGGGYEHSDANPREALSRELQEEMNVEIVDMEERPSYFMIAQAANSYLQANIFYRVTLSSLDFTRSDECQEIGFFTPEEALNLKAFLNVAEFCKHYKI